MKSVFNKVAAAATLLMGVASTANAFVVLTMTDLSTATTVTCNTFIGFCGAGFVVNNANNVNFIGTVGAFDVASTQGISNAPGNALVAFANTTSLAVNRNDGALGTKTLTVDFVVFDFFNPTSTSKTMQGSASTTAGQGLFNAATETIFTNFRVDSNNTTSLNLGPTVSQLSCGMATSINDSCNAGSIVWSDPVLGVAGFSTRTQQAFTLEAASIVNTTSSLTIRNVPEPMTLSLVGVSLLGLAFASRRRAAAKA